MALDLAGLIDPTPLSDGANGIVSQFRSDFLPRIRAASFVSGFPYHLFCPG
jgi:hypothetical protein